MYTSTKRYGNGVCRGKRILAAITFGASADSCAYNGREGDSRLHIWPLLFPFHYVGFDVLQPSLFHGVGGVASIEEHEDGISDLDRYAMGWEKTLGDLENHPAIMFNRDDDFDETKRLKRDAPVYSPFIAHQPMI